MSNLNLDLTKFITAETLSRHKIYGVSFDGITNKGVRLYDAEGLNWSPSNTTVLGYDDFKTRKPFKIKRCLMKPGRGGASCTIDSYYDDLNLNLEQYNQKAKDENLDRFIEYDVYYYTRPNPWTWLISPDYIDGFYPCPACDRGGKILSKWYMGEYMPNKYYRILDGYSPITGISNEEARDALRAKGYRLSDYANYNSVVMLALVKYADMDFSDCVGTGGCGDPDYEVVSNGDKILGDDGEYDIYNFMDIESIKVMGIVDFYGGVFKKCDAVFEYDGHIYVNDDLDNITEWPIMDTWEAMGYKKSTFTLPNGDGDYTSTICKLAYDPQFPWMTYPVGKLGVNRHTETELKLDVSPITDRCMTNNDSTMRCVLLGGPFWDTVNLGPFTWDSTDELFDKDWSSGCLATAFPVCHS